MKPGVRANNRRSAGQHIFEDLRSRVTSGEWSPGSKLPSIRDLARSYAVAPLTMSRVIRDLESANLVTAIPSKGIYASTSIPAPDPVSVDTSWQMDLLRRQPARSFSVSVPQRIPDDTVNLATGTMSNEAVPIESLRRAIRRTAKSYVEGPVWERSAQGEVAVREWFANDLSQAGIHATSDSTMIVSSTHQAFRVIANTIIDPGDVVLIEAPSDPIVMGVFELAGARCIGVDVDSVGMQTSLVRELAARHRPKIIVTCPSGQVPTGVTMSPDRREELVRIAEEFRILIVEYDNGNEVWYDSPAPKPVKSWDRSGCVVLVRDISRITMAGFRVGCLTVEGPLLQRLVDSKRRDDLITSTLAQHALLNYVTGPDYSTNLGRMRAFYKPRRDALLATLEREMPDTVSWTPPNIGFHLWLQLPEKLSARSIAQEAAMLGVIVAPSEIFSLDGSLDNCLRITFSTNPPDLLEKGIQRLAQAIRRALTSGTSSTMTRTYEVV
jgi:DNA-binding transcriptional MocR family regulator